MNHIQLVEAERMIQKTERAEKWGKKQIREGEGHRGKEMLMLILANSNFFGGNLAFFIQFMQTNAF